MSIPQTTAPHSLQSTYCALVRTDLLIVLVAQKYLSTRRAAKSLASLACQNLHSLVAAPSSCGTAGPISLDAISCHGAFRTPVAGARGEIVVAGVRKPYMSAHLSRSFRTTPINSGIANMMRRARAQNSLSAGATAGRPWDLSIRDRAPAADKSTRPISNGSRLPALLVLSAFSRSSVDVHGLVR